jgi:hypothetical protein
VPADPRRAAALALLALRLAAHRLGVHVALRHRDQAVADLAGRRGVAAQTLLMDGKPREKNHAGSDRTGRLQ